MVARSMLPSGISSTILNSLSVGVEAECSCTYLGGPDRGEDWPCHNVRCGSPIEVRNLADRTENEQVNSKDHFAV